MTTLPVYVDLFLVTGMLVIFHTEIHGRPPVFFNKLVDLNLTLRLNLALRSLSGVEALELM